MFYHFVHLAIYYVEEGVMLKPHDLAKRSVGIGIYALLYRISSFQIAVTLRENRGILY